MVHMRARQRSLLFPSALIAIAVAVGIWMLFHAITPTQQLEKLGFSNVTAEQPEGNTPIFKTVINNCEVDLFTAHDTEMLTAIIEKTPDGKALTEQGYEPGTGVIMNVKDANDLKSRSRFSGICPP